jgi:hypothetical protein
MARVRSDLALEELPVAQIRGRRLVRRRHVNEFVIHDRKQALRGRGCFEGEWQRRNIDEQAVAGQGIGGRVAVVREVGHQRRDL